MQTYLDMAGRLQMAHAVALGPDQVYFDLRALLKCRWGCQDYFQQSIKCHPRDTTFQQRMDMVKCYRNILLLHSPDAHKLSKAVLAIERQAFLDGHYFAFGLRYCNLCPQCALDQGQGCPQPEKVRPCDQSFGIDVYRTARGLGLPCQVLQSREQTPNRYGFVLID